MKKCSFCKKPNKYAGNQCYSCLKRHPSKTPGTLEYFKTKTWSALNERTINGARPRWGHKAAMQYLSRGRKLLFSKDEFYSFCDANKNLILALYASGDKPSLDRKDTDGNYSLSNIRVLSLKENLSRPKCL